MSNLCLRRIQKDLGKYFDAPPQNIYLHAEPQNIKIIHALVVGPSETPYEGGFFYFYIEVPDKYPFSPPKVTLKTTAGGRVRFNPNLYACGKVCLSILGTWSGPGWAAMMNFSSLLLSIQTLMNEQPWFNEPGREGRKDDKSLKESESYNIATLYHTLRFGVVDVLMHDCVKLTDELYEKAVCHFKTNIDRYRELCDQNSQFDDTMQSGGFGNTVQVNFTAVRAKIDKVYSEMK